MKKNFQGNYSLFVPLCISLVLFCVGCGKRDDSAAKTQFEIDKVYKRGPLIAHVRIDKAKITIAQTLLVELEASVQPPYKVQMPSINEVLKDFGMVDWQNLGDRLDPNNSVVTTLRYRLEPFLSGKYSLPAFTFEFTDANSTDKTTHKLTTEPIDVEVTSLLGEDRSKLTIADIEDIVQMPSRTSFLWLWMAGGICVLSAVAVWLYVRRKRKRKLIRIFKPAHEIAFDRLRALVSEDLVSAGRIKEFYERASNILRHYIEDRFELMAPERTTEEFLAELQWTEVLSPDDKQALAEFLSHCDLVKFAKHTPTTEQIQHTFDLVKSFIEETKSDEYKVDVTDKANAEQPVEIGSS